MEMIVVVYRFIVPSLFIILIMINILVIKKLKKIIKEKENNSIINIDTTKLLTVKIDRNGNFIDFNNRFAEMFSFRNVQSFKEIIADENDLSYDNLIEIMKKGNDLENINLKLINCVEKEFHVIFTSKKIKDDRYEYIELVGIDITERVEYENKKSNWNLENIDSLTNLFNRTYFIEECNKILNKEGIMGALVIIDVDNIGHCNNIFGPKKTDEIIKDIATRIYKMTRKDNLIGKLGSDEFAILLTDMSKKEIEEYLNTLIEINTINIADKGVTLHLSISAGVSLFPKNGNNYDSLIKTASLALRNAKDNGKGQYVLYNDLMEKKLLDKMRIQALIRDGIENDRFFLVYQPQYNMNTGEINGFEALIRLRDEKNEIIMPNSFINIAEETKLIIPLGYWVIQQACEFIIRLQNKGINNLTVSINVSVVQFLQYDFVLNVKSIIENYNINPRLIEIEITETSLMHFDQKNLNKINELRKMGINIAIDDFGTGYSSLLYFKKTTNISVLKIDKEFIDDITLNDNNTEIVNAIIYLAHKFNYKVIAEGVETEEQYNILTKLGCDLMQGYLGSKPIIEEYIYECYDYLLNIKNKLKGGMMV